MDLPFRHVSLAGAGAPEDNAGGPGESVTSSLPSDHRSTARGPTRDTTKWRFSYNLNE